MTTASPIRLLTIDDEEAIRSGITAYFEDSGFVVAEACDGQKVDRSFVQRLHETPSTTAVVNTIIAMAQELGLDIVAEGVETEEQKSHLIKRNCTTIQGFLFSRPLTSEQVVEFIHQWRS